MVEYGGVVRQTGGGTSNPMGGGGDLLDIVSDTVGRIAALPPEVLLVIGAVIVLGGLLVLRRGL
jgi:hypothetical protein